jgi:hypothetical protein
MSAVPLATRMRETGKGRSSAEIARKQLGNARGSKQEGASYVMLCVQQRRKIQPTTASRVGEKNEPRELGKPLPARAWTPLIPGWDTRLWYPALIPDYEHDHAMLLLVSLIF